MKKEDVCTECSINGINDNHTKLVIKPEYRPKCGWKNNIKMSFADRYETVDWITSLNTTLK